MSHLYALSPFITESVNCSGKKHCVKSVQIRSHFWSVFSCIRTEYRDLRSKIHAVKPVQAGKRVIAV